MQALDGQNFLGAANLLLSEEAARTDFGHTQTIAAIMAKLADGRKADFSSKDKVEAKLAEWLREKNIKRVLEIGPGSSSIILPLAGALKKAGCEVHYAGGDLERYEKRDLDSRGFTQAANYFDRKNMPNAKYDLIIAQNVFSSGGNLATHTRELVTLCNRGAAHAARSLTHRESFAVLSEYCAAMPITRRALEAKAKVHLWATIENYYGNNLQELGGRYLKTGRKRTLGATLAEAPNIVVFGPKARHARK